MAAIMNHCFQITCYLATFALFCFCFYIFCKNDDLIEVSFKQYNEDSMSTYPSATICFLNPVKEDILQKHGEGINKSSYVSYLQGLHWDERMLNISNEEVTINLQDYVVSATAHYNEDPDEYHEATLESFKVSEITTHYGFLKCLTYDMPKHEKEKMMYAAITIRTNIFPNGIRPQFYNMAMIFHSRNKLFRPWIAMKYDWPQRSSKSSNHYKMAFEFKSLEVLRRRNKMQARCNDGDNYDEEFQAKLMQKVGCSPPYWIPQQNMTQCKSKQDMKHFGKYVYDQVSGRFVNVKDNFPPCLVLEKILFDYTENNVDYTDLKLLEPRLEIPQNATLMMILLQFLEPNFKEIKQVKAFGIESLVGNVGGYIGLFLGYSFLQLPNFLLSVYQKCTLKFTTPNQNSNNLSLADEGSNANLTVDNNLKDIETIKEKLCSIEKKLCSLEEKLVK